MSSCKMIYPNEFKLTTDCSNSSCILWPIMLYQPPCVCLWSPDIPCPLHYLDRIGRKRGTGKGERREIARANELALPACGRSVVWPNWFLFHHDSAARGKQRTQRLLRRLDAFHILWRAIEHTFRIKWMSRMSAAQPLSLTPTLFGKPQMTSSQYPLLFLQSLSHSMNYAPYLNSLWK